MKVDGVSNPAAVTAGSYTFTNVTANHTIAATFAILTYTITPTAGAGGTITPGTLQTVNYGGSATFTIAPDTGFVIDDVLVDGVSNPAAVTAGSYTFSNVTANHTIAATFKVATFVITPTAGAGGTITPGTPQTVNYGDSPTFTIAADTGYDIVDVLVDGVSQGAITQLHLQQRDGEPHHRSPLHDTDLRDHADGGCQAARSRRARRRSVNYGGSVTFTIAPNTGYRILDVLVDGVSNPAAVTAGSYTFSNVTANHTIAATFAILTYTITPTAGAGGTITPGTPQTVNYDGSATFTIAPNTGYVIDDVLVDGVSNPAAVTAGSYTFTNVTANHTIAATFEVLTYTIIPSAGAGGTITPSTLQTVNYGGSATFTIAATPYYRIMDVKVDGMSQGAITSYTFNNVTADHVIAATFEKIRLLLPLILK